MMAKDSDSIQKSIETTSSKMTEVLRNSGVWRPLVLNTFDAALLAHRVHNLRNVVGLNSAVPSPLRVDSTVTPEPQGPKQLVPVIITLSQRFRLPISSAKRIIHSWAPCGPQEPRG